MREDVEAVQDELAALKVANSAMKKEIISLTKEKAEEIELLKQAQIQLQKVEQDLAETRLTLNYVQRDFHRQEEGMD